MEIQEDPPEALSVEIDDGIADARLEGELSIQSVDALKDSFFGLLNARQIRLDLARVTDIDSCGLQLVIILQQQARLQQRGFQLSGSNPLIDQLLDVHHLTLPREAPTETAP